MAGLFLFLLLSMVASYSQGLELNLTNEVAKELAGLPLDCYNKEYPFKFNNQWQSAEEVGEHKNYIPIFSGCFDWHSAVHGHWLLAAVLNRFPDDAELTKQIVTVFDQQFKVNYPHKSSLIA